MKTIPKYEFADGYNIAYEDALLIQNNTDENGNFVEVNKISTEIFSQDTSFTIKRALSYPPITDYIDGVVKGDQEQIQNYIDACLEVKAKYPKP